MRATRPTPAPALSADDALRQWRDMRGDAVPTPAEQIADARASALAAERARSSEIIEVAHAAGLPNFGRRHVLAGTSVADFRRLLDERQEKGRAARAAREAEAARAEVEAAEHRFRVLARLMPHR